MNKRKKGDEEEKGEVVCDKMNVEGDETREKRKRGEVEYDDVMKRAKSSSSGQVKVSAEETMKILRKLEREERKRKRDDGAQDVDDVEVAGFVVNAEVMNGEVPRWTVTSWTLSR